MERRPGFGPDELKGRYDVETIIEDEWHSYSGQMTSSFVADHLPKARTVSRVLLNAGSGVHQIAFPSWETVSVDLFVAPMRTHPRIVCASVEKLPFQPNEFGAVVCVGEVLGYCDPAKAISEFARVLEPGGMLICDFGNSKGIRHWFTCASGRAADLITDTYNGAPERIWIYDPRYVRSLLKSFNFHIVATAGTHKWSALARKAGALPAPATRWQRRLWWLPMPNGWADVLTIAALRS